jgi:serine/threonine protein kinase
VSEPATDPYLGRLLDGRFSLTRRLGQGGMGAVYLADQRSMGREVAVKVITPGRLEGADTDALEAASRFVREARLTARVASPHVVSVIDAGRTEDGVLFLAMERLHGRGLDAIIADEAPLPPARAAGIAVQIALALEAAHAQGIIHRDLKPSNVIVLSEPADRDFVKVLDFGIARSLAGDHTTLTRRGDLFGTPAYLSPEMARGQPCGPASDVYALGLITYELLAGRRPFEPVPTPLAASLQHLTETPLPLPATVPAALASVVLRLMAREPEDRPATAARARIALEDALRLGGGPPAPAPESEAPFASPPTRGRPAWPLLVALGAGVVGATYLAWPEPRVAAVEAAIATVEPVPPPMAPPTSAPPTSAPATSAPPVVSAPPPASAPRRRLAPTPPPSAPATDAERFMLPGAP